ncbi:hypothetical protein N0A02_13570 [Paraburkholderia acidicola]|uniref:Uncharacterized protein n=1 Tax=Paraburkholderia acidicola TaxID=1912599 RepID=A0ABV1LND5_9BURK
MRHVPDDFPREPYDASLAGSQPKFAVESIDGKYCVGLTDEELLERSRGCEEWNGSVNGQAFDDNDDGWPFDMRHHFVLCDPEFRVSLQRTELELLERLLFFSDARMA